MDAKKRGGGSFSEKQLKFIHRVYPSDWCINKLKAHEFARIPPVKKKNASAFNGWRAFTNSEDSVDRIAQLKKKKKEEKILACESSVSATHRPSRFLNYTYDAFLSSSFFSLDSFSLFFAACLSSSFCCFSFRRSQPCEPDRWQQRPRLI